MNNTNFSMSITERPLSKLNLAQKLGLGLGSLSLLIILTCISSPGSLENLWFAAIILSMVAGSAIYTYGTYNGTQKGIKNDTVWISSLTNGGGIAWALGLLITGFYVLLYWFPAILGLQTGADGSNQGLIGLFDPISMWLKGKPASQWFMYGFFYTVLILVFGVKFIIKYRHNRYQVIRTCSVMFFQLVFAFLLPEILLRLNLPYFDMKNMWPLNYYFFFDWNIDQLIANGSFGLFMLFWGIAMIFIISPVLTYFFGKRWYCSWVCGCGGLAETAGDPFRQLSDKSTSAWKLERWLIHSVMVFAFVMTLAVLYSYFSQKGGSVWISRNFFIILSVGLLGLIGVLLLLKNRFLTDLDPLARKVGLVVIAVLIAALLISHFSGTAELFIGLHAQFLREWYGFLIGAAFSGVIGVGFYPMLGSRVWCRFGCPMAAILGLQQKFFSRFRITTNGAQCISCGNCSTYCEMGIDVRAYAQKGQDIVRSSCVGCGICSAVCPRGVLRLENSSLDISSKATQLRTQFVHEDEVGLL